MSRIYESNNPLEIINFFKSKGILVSEPPICSSSKCREKNKEMSWSLRGDTHDGGTWRCTSCGTYRSLRHNSFFQTFSISMTKIIRLIWYWCLQQVQVDTMDITGVSQPTITAFHQQMRIVTHLAYDPESIRLGGPGRKVEIDESLFIKVFKLNPQNLKSIDFYQSHNIILNL